mmetsp:Transcript_6901/g.10050  ORF Transcript_6901/g.10050 Transcript_6901/m.10050 type:complete len:389 (-) Transcript_6901:125-1291(-)
MTSKALWTILSVASCCCGVLSSSLPSSVCYSLENVGSYCEGEEWANMSLPVQQYLRDQGWTSVMWDNHSNDDPYWDLDWDEMPLEWQNALLTLGWTDETWDSESAMQPLSHYTPWKKLFNEEKEAAKILGFVEDEWLWGNWGEEFNPVVLRNLSIPELQVMDLDYLSRLDVMVELRDGDTVGDDEFGVREKMHMSDYIQALRSGSKLYLKYEDHDAFKQHIRREVGEKVLQHLVPVIQKSVLREQGIYKKVFDHVSFNDRNWLIWVGGANTTTSMHWDADVFNLLWVVQGRKRVVLIPNDERTAGDYECQVEVEDGEHSCWTNIDILSGPLPPHAVEIEIGPGEGVYLPHLSWHAVQNLESTVAYGFRIDVDQEEEAIRIVNQIDTQV